MKLLNISGTSTKCPTLVVEPYGYLLLPTMVKGVSVPLACAINRWPNATNSPVWLKLAPTNHYVVWSDIPSAPKVLTASKDRA
jgi:hypothetical protein